MGAKTFIAALLMGSVIFYLQRLSIFLLLPLGVLVYISATTLLRTIPREDMQSLLKAVKGKGKRSSQISAFFAVPEALRNGLNHT